jgi:hypothetical protein
MVTVLKSNTFVELLLIYMILVISLNLHYHFYYYAKFICIAVE